MQEIMANTTEPVKARLLDNGAETTKFSEVRMWHYEETGELWWCDICHDHHETMAQIEDPPIPFAATFGSVTGNPFTHCLVDYDNGSRAIVGVSPITPNGGDHHVPIPK